MNVIDEALNIGLYLVLVGSGFYAGYWHGRVVEVQTLLDAKLHKFLDTDERQP